MPGQNKFEICSKNSNLLVSGEIEWQDKHDEVPETVSLTSEEQTILTTMGKDEIYSYFKKAGYVFPPDLQSLISLSVTKEGILVI